MNHTEAFAQFQAARESERQKSFVTWRRVSEDTGGGFSGLGRNGWLVWVKGDEYGYSYGRVIGKQRIRLASAPSLAEAKRLAAELIS